MILIHYIDNNLLFIGHSINLKPFYNFKHYIIFLNTISNGKRRRKI